MADRVMHTGRPELGVAPPRETEAANDGGDPLAPEVRAYFEPRFGVDFSRVRVHADAGAAESARLLHARAFTLGSNIFFGRGEYAPGSTQGMHLLAHELAHVTQPPAPDTARRQVSPEQARIAQLIADYDAAVARLDWQGAAEFLNGFNDVDIGTRLARLTGTEQAEMRRGATSNPRLGGGTRLTGLIDARNPDARRIALLIEAYESARQRGAWRVAAEQLNGFADTDIALRVRRLSSADRTKLRSGATASPRLGGGARLARAVDVADVEQAIVAAQASAATARAYLTAFQGLSATEQERRINLLPSGIDARATLGRLFAALPPAELDGGFRDTIRQISELLERRVARESTGRTDAQMAQVQATFMDQQAAAAAAAAAGAPPTPAQVQQAHQGSVNAAGIGTRTVNRWTALPNAAAQAAFRTRAATAIAAVVARAATQAPELGITAAQIQFRPDLIDGATDTRYAEVGSGGGLNVGMDFIDAAAANPDYVLGVVVHEIYGHPAHGNDMNQSYTFQIFNQARPLATQALSPAARAAPPSSADTFAYGYHGTEIYAELREFRYAVQAPRGAGVVQGDRPADDILLHVNLIKTQFAPDLARGFLRGLYARFRIDPRVTPAALALFTRAVDRAFPGEHLLQ